MVRRFVSIICIMFLLFTITSPLSGSIFSYADEPQQEQLSQDEVIKAAIALYLNERKAWIVNQTGDSIDTVQGVMQSWIDSYDFWTNHTTIGSAAEFYANCIIKYNPFRISLKGPAVRALNDLYDWLIESGKLGNLDNSTGGETTDNLYEGYHLGTSLFYIIDGKLPNSNNDNFVQYGSSVGQYTGSYLYSLFAAGQSNDNAKDMSNFNAGVSVTIPVQYAANNVQQVKIWKIVSQQADDYPFLSVGTTTNNRRNIYSTRVNKVDGCLCWYSNRQEAANVFHYGMYSKGVNHEWCHSFGTYTRDDGDGINGCNVNLYTNNFDKTNPTPPEDGEELEYTPEDKDTGNTYNTYNEYITNYVKKNTVVNNNNEPAPGGTTPPWDDGTTTVNPDGGGGYDVSLPDLTLPDLNIDWSINGLKDKFPFSIPWDLMAFFTVLNADPETPEFTGQVDLGIYLWDIDINLHDFDLVAALVRNLEFIAFCIGLIIVTRSIIKG